jgi:hypothetical protein
VGGDCGSLIRSSGPKWLLPCLRAVQGDAADDKADARKLGDGRHLAKHGETDPGRGGRQQRQQQSEAGARQPAHRELVANIRDDRRGRTDADRRFHSG